MAQRKRASAIPPLEASLSEVVRVSEQVEAAKDFEGLLDAIELVIRNDLENPRLRLKTNALWRQDLMEALTALGRAREEFKRDPRGAALAFHILDIEEARLAPFRRRDANQYQGQLKGANSTKTKKRPVPKLHREIRSMAAALDPSHTDSAKAKLLKQKWGLRLTEDHIRHILAKTLRPFRPKK